MTRILFRAVPLAAITMALAATASVAGSQPPVPSPEEVAGKLQEVVERHTTYEVSYTMLTTSIDPGGAVTSEVTGEGTLRRNGNRSYADVLFTSWRPLPEEQSEQWRGTAVLGPEGFSLCETPVNSPTAAVLYNVSFDAVDQKQAKSLKDYHLNNELADPLRQGYSFRTHDFAHLLRPREDVNIWSEWIDGQLVTRRAFKAHPNAEVVIVWEDFETGLIASAQSHTPKGYIQDVVELEYNDPVLSAAGIPSTITKTSQTPAGAASSEFNTSRRVINVTAFTTGLSSEVPASLLCNEYAKVLEVN